MGLAIMLQRIQSLFQPLIRRRFRIRAGFVVACWLLLNMQLALAAHHTPTSPSEINEPQSVTHTQMPGMQHAAPQKALCEKHCNPDNAQTSSPSLQLTALPVDATLLLVASHHTPCIEPALWQQPPVTGPPAEIRFCRFRE